MQCLAINSCYILCPLFVLQSFQDSSMYTRPLDIIPEVHKALCLKIFFFLFFRLYNSCYFIFRFSCSFLCCLQGTMQWIILFQIFYFQFHILLVIFSSCFFLRILWFYLNIFTLCMVRMTSLNSADFSLKIIGALAFIIFLRIVCVSWSFIGWAVLDIYCTLWMLHCSLWALL